MSFKVGNGSGGRVSGSEWAIHQRHDHDAELEVPGRDVAASVAAAGGVSHKSDVLVLRCLASQESRSEMS